MVDMAALRSENATRWANAKLTRNFVSVAKSLISPPAKARYQNVEKFTGVPWFVIAVIHEREASQDWRKSLAQGDPWNMVSIHVPKGRGPFQSWEAAAIDALVNCSPFAAHNHDWSVGGTLTLLEEYNGIGYAARGRPSPYVWSGTNQYVSGKFVRDGVYDANVVDQQLGCAGILKSMAELDTSVQVGGKINPVTPPPDVVSKVTAPSTNSGSVGMVASILKALLGRG